MWFTVVIKAKFPELHEFKKLSQDFQKLSENYSKQVEIEKIRAISTQNHLKTISKQRQGEQQFYQSKIQEMSQVLEKLKMEYQYLQRVESEQMEVINNFIQNQWFSSE